MNIGQTKALESLARAFARCGKVGLIFYGMDGNLNAVPQRIHDKITDDGEKHITDVHEIQDHMVHVDTDDTYQDSGGW